jgi:transcriptional regulator with XRE-family HTH domain
MSRINIQMETIGQTLRNKRKELGLLLRHVSAYADVDQAILSKIERNERKPTKRMLDKFSEILELDKEKLMVEFLSDKIAYELAQEDCAQKALKVAEKKIEFLKSQKTTFENESI